MAKQISDKTLRKRATAQTDMAARSWCMRVYRLRDEYQARTAKSRPLKRENGAIEWRSCIAQPFSAVLKNEHADSGRGFNIDTLVLQSIWNQAAGSEIAPFGTVHALTKNGKLTVIIKSSPILLEIRQFHHTRLFAELTRLWPTTWIPLTKVEYKPGIKEKTRV